jgi:DNA-binding transcriptional MerR regulator
MAKHKGVNASMTYRIGAVSRLTGIAPDTLRIWERRYGVVQPQRSPAGGRLYSSDDVTRLTLLKQLVDAGDAIGTIAHLELEDLKQRAGLATAARPAGAAASGSPCRVLLIGRNLAQALESAADRLRKGNVEVVACVEDVSRLPDSAEADVLVLEQTTLHEDTATRIGDLIQRCSARSALVIYRYASSQALQRLPASRCTALRAPLQPAALQSFCLAVMGGGVPARRAVDTAPLTDQPPAARRYDDDTLARLAGLSSAVRCECPQHLAELIASLSAFERYSAECESRNPADAVLHAYLHETAAHARALVEDALDHVIKVEGIEV